MANLAGAHIALRGAVAALLDGPAAGRLRLRLRRARHGSRAEARGVGAPAGLGALRLRGGVAGNWESLTLRDCALDAMGWSVLANGALALPGAAEGTIKSGSYKGNIVVNGQPIEAAIDADLSAASPSFPPISGPTRSTSAGWAAAGRPAPRPRHATSALSRSRSARRCAASTVR